MSRSQAKHDLTIALHPRQSLVVVEAKALCKAECVWCTQGSIDEAGKLRDQMRGYAGRVEAVQWELKAAEDAKLDHEARLQAITQTAHENKRALDDESSKLVQERAKRQRCEDDAQVRSYAALLLEFKAS